MTQIKEALETMGFKLRDFGKNFRARPIYRDSNNDNSLIIDKRDGKWYDFGINQGGSIHELIQMVTGLNLYQKEELCAKLANSLPLNNQRSDIKINFSQKNFSEEDLNKLEKDYSYWNRRGISNETLELFRCGVEKSGRLANRFVFPVFDGRQKIIGLCGRTLIESKIKWKILGTKNEFKYPLFINLKDLKEKKEIILVESIGDCLALFECGIRNVMVLFGTKASNAVITTLIKLDPEKIYVSLNNEPGNAMIGNIASKTILGRLSRYFDRKRLKIHLPNDKDLGETLLKGKTSIQTWYNER